VSFGLTASSDGRRIFYSRVGSSIDELMLVDDFRWLFSVLAWQTVPAASKSLSLPAFACA
jgi:hypothetical protein